MQSGELAGLVALRGRARALPDAEPLVSPNGELCLWFRATAPPRDSARPFVLVDDSGECIVLPVDADITGSIPVPAAVGWRSGRARGGQPTPECLLRNGDPVHVTGRFVGASPEALVLQAQAGALAQHGLLLPVIAAPGPGQPLRIRIGSEDGEGGVFGLLAVADSLVLLVASSLVAWALLVQG